MHEPPDRRRRGLRGADVASAVGSLASTAVALLAVAALSDSLRLGVVEAVGVAVLVAVLDLVARPVLRLLAHRGGAGVALLLGLTVQLGAVLLALRVVTRDSAVPVRTAAVTLLVVGLTGAVVRWCLASGDHEYVVADLVARARRHDPSRGRSGAAGRPGVVIVQIDGLPYPLLDQGVVSGNLPTLARWVRSGRYTAQPWWVRVPSTTPASQAGLLHGCNDGIPAFRWYDPELGRLVVANRPADAALIEQRLSDGAGLLAEGGVSIGNLFSGDAPTNLLVMSRAGRRGGLGPGGAYLRFFASPFVLARATLSTVGEMVKELFQARQQRARGIEPRTHRGWDYVVLRGLTNALMRHLTVGLVADQMVRGAPVIYVNFVDYDEIAHHAGPARRESLDALAGIDRVLRTLEEILPAAGRDYRFVVLSDHGQSQGPTFRQLTGRSLEDVVRGLTTVDPDGAVAATGDAESWGQLNTLLADVLSASPVTSPLAERHARRASRGGTGAGTDARGRRGQGPPAVCDLVVAASGCLGLVWFPAAAGRDLEDLRSRHPALVPGLLAEPAVGFVVVRSSQGPLALSTTGVHVLRTGTVTGEDPLADYGPDACRDLLRVASMVEAPDVLVHSTVDPSTGEVHAFEELVGSHGGLGGDQNHAVLLHPAEWPLAQDGSDPDGRHVLRGADAVHRQLVRWLEDAGLRTVGVDGRRDDVPSTVPRTSTSTVDPAS
ncbi:alkaline phosphatase family protein [Cellulomonas sp. S1-8]|uniref:alkaline phosphatase family protein n=1 Tax=Cellulomonas sp. S1-8 TaxID=2904790 RepID=UPI0022446AAC|nr:alkaline phosphatase family protein [Cellulomonas sp. S1-8]UZN03680.1 alkaline phosphatase family protein [Cellulomonas sp. S1-8]